MDPLASIVDPVVAAHLLDPLRARILVLAREPLSASQIAERVGMQRQRVNYHVKTLRAAGLLREAGRREKRNLTEILYQASAARYLVDPLALGALAPTPDAMPQPSAEALVAGAARVQSEAMRATERDVVYVDAEVRLASASDREHLARAIQAAITGAGASARGPAYRVMLGCYQKPRETP